MRHVLIGLVAALLAACTADIPNGVLACEFDNACPTGFVCRRAAPDAGDAFFCFDTGASDTGRQLPDGGISGAGGGSSGTGGASGTGGSGGSAGTSGMGGSGGDLDAGDLDASDASDADANLAMCDESMCDPHASCDQPNGRCVCDIDYEGNGMTCTKLPKCLDATNGGCDTEPMATCSDATNEARTCDCPGLYNGDGIGSDGCTMDNPCLTNNGGCNNLATCIHNPGAAPTCDCPDGYSGNGVGSTGCTDINECTTNADNCAATQFCTNNLGGFTCSNCATITSCASGLTCTGPSNSTCGTCAAGSVGNGTSACTDITCAMNNGGCDTSPRATCTEVIGGPNTCTCPGFAGYVGYTGNGVGPNGCTNINECLSTNNCDRPGYPCVDEPGSYYCSGQFSPWQDVVSRAYTKANGTVSDQYTGLMWQEPIVAQQRAQSGATMHCDDLSLGGYDDWRLPSIVELESLVSDSRTSPALNLAAFAETNAAPTQWSGFWSSTPYFTSGSAYAVDFGSGESIAPANATNAWVRCVRTISARSNAAPPQLRYSVSNGTVLDNRTGLRWEQAQTLAITHGDASARCTSLTIPGGGWRMPTRSELLSLIDRTGQAHNPMLSAVFAAMAGSGQPFWTSSANAGVSGEHWAVDLYLGTTRAYDSTTQRAVRCVRLDP